jgi:hypothetical protein
LLHISDRSLNVGGPGWYLVEVDVLFFGYSLPAAGRTTPNCPGLEMTHHDFGEALVYGEVRGGPSLSRKTP